LAKKKRKNDEEDDGASIVNLFDEHATQTASPLPYASSYHAPVMWKDCIQGLLGCARAKQRRKNQNCENNDGITDNEEDDNQRLIFVDGTLGGGGHSEALLQQLQPGDIVLGCDVDPNALKTASKRLEAYMQPSKHKPLFVPVQSNFCQLATVLPTIRYPTKEEEDDSDGKYILPFEKNCIDGILLDLGVSSHQIDTPERGFAFMKDGPLDMRMSSSNGNSFASLTAADLCNELEESELAQIFKRYGDERSKARAIAKSIVQHRPLITTGQLQEAVSAVVPAFHKQSKRLGRTATLARVFQSLRIVVNQEDKVLQQVMEETCPALLRQGGRLVVLSYHSLEDRVTKRVMRDGTAAKQRGSPERDMYGDYIGPAKPFKPVGKFIKASEEEVAANPRARSATLRIADRLEIVDDDDDDDDDDYRSRRDEIER
jgi:16S rRNA (cytosine1402-N4)-methyltransferase